MIYAIEIDFHNILSELEWKAKDSDMIAGFTQISRCKDDEVIFS